MDLGEFTTLPLGEFTISRKYYVYRNFTQTPGVRVVEIPTPEVVRLISMTLIITHVIIFLFIFFS